MKRLFKSLYWIFVTVIMMTWILSAADLLEQVIQPAKNYDQIINLGNNREAIGNEVFREGTSVDTISEVNCFRSMDNPTPAACQSEWWVWFAKTGIQCYERTPLAVEGNNLWEREANCGTVWGEWFLALGVTVAEKEPLIVRITKWLLRLTVAISITMIIFIAVKIISSWITGQWFTEWIKDIRNLVIWLILALSSVSIIWIIQSITLSSLSWAPANLDEVTQPLN